MSFAYTVSYWPKRSNKISFKKEGLPSCNECFNLFVRHLGTFVNASHDWYTVSKFITKKLIIHHNELLR